MTGTENTGEHDVNDDAVGKLEALHDEEYQTIIIQNLKLIVLIMVIRLGWWKIRPKINFFSTVIKA